MKIKIFIMVSIVLILATSCVNKVYEDGDIIEKDGVIYEYDVPKFNENFRIEAPIYEPDSNNKPLYHYAYYFDMENEKDYPMMTDVIKKEPMPFQNKILRDENDNFNSMAYYFLTFRDANPYLDNNFEKLNYGNRNAITYLKEKYTGFYVKGYNENMSSSVDIPEKINGNRVIGIGYEAFKGADFNSIFIAGKGFFRVLPGGISEIASDDSSDLTLSIDFGNRDVEFFPKAISNIQRSTWININAISDDFSNGLVFFDSAFKNNCELEINLNDSKLANNEISEYYVKTNDYKDPHGWNVTNEFLAGGYIRPIFDNDDSLSSCVGIKLNYDYFMIDNLYINDSIVNYMPNYGDLTKNISISIPFYYLERSELSPVKDKIEITYYGMPFPYNPPIYISKNEIKTYYLTSEFMSVFSKFTFITDGVDTDIDDSNNLFFNLKCANSDEIVNIFVLNLNNIDFVKTDRL